MPHTYSSIELLTCTYISKDLYALPMIFDDPYIQLDGCILGMENF